MQEEELKQKNLIKDIKEGRAKLYDGVFDDWVFPETEAEFTRDDMFVAYFKYGQEIMDEEWQANTFRDDQVIEGSNKLLTDNVNRLQQTGKRKMFKKTMSDPQSIKFKKPSS